MWIRKVRGFCVELCCYNFVSVLVLNTTRLQSGELNTVFIASVL